MNHFWVRILFSLFSAIVLNLSCSLALEHNLIALLDAWTCQIKAYMPCKVGKYLQHTLLLSHNSMAKGQALCVRACVYMYVDLATRN